MKNFGTMTLCTLLAGVMTASNTLHAEKAAPADSFVDSIGVMLHMSYTDTPYYKQWPQVLAELQALGVRHYRDGYFPWDPAKVPYYQRHRELRAAGLRGDIIIPWNPATTPEQIVNFCRLATDCEALEDPNEINASHMPDWIDRLKAMLPVIDNAAKSLQVPVYGPSFTRSDAYSRVGDIGSTMTYNNLHIYFGGRLPGSHGWGPKGYGSIDYWKQLAQIDGPGKPSVVTESGYMTQPAKPYTVPEDLETAYTLRTLLDMYNAGIVRTYIYEFLDENESPNYGIVRADLTPKPAYTALAHLIALLSDEGPAFTPGELNYSIQGNDPDVHHLLLQKRDGSYYLALWLEASSYDTARTQRTPVTPRPLSITLPAASSGHLVEIHDDGSLTSKPLPHTADISLNLTGNLTLIALSPRPGRPAPDHHRDAPLSR